MVNYNMAKNTKGFQDTCVLIPCHNEEATIAEVIKQFRKTLPKSKIIVINNNSTDNTGEVAKKSGALVIDEIKVGKGFAVRQGFKNAKRQIIVMVDGDLTYDPATAIRMVDLVRSGADMVVAFRENFEKSTYRKGHVFGNYLFSKFQLKALKVTVTDTLSGYRAFSNLYIESFVMQPSGFEIEAALNIQASMVGATVENINSKYYSRPHNSNSKLNTFRDGARILYTILRYLVKLRPAFVFSILGIIIFMLSFFLSLIPATEFLATGKILHIPTLITSFSMSIISALAFFYGLIAQKIVDFQTESMQRDFKYLKLRKLD